jgi:hypothetical protein
VRDTRAQEPVQGQPAAARDGALVRIRGILVSPGETYAAVEARPQTARVLLVVLVVIVTANATFFSTEVGRQALLDQLVRTLESFGRQISDPEYRWFEQMLPWSPYAVAAVQIVMLPAAMLVVSGLLLATFNGLLGGRARFLQVFAVVVHSGLVIACQQVVAKPLDYARESMSSPTNLTVLLPFLDENSFAARLSGSIDFFIIWWTVSLSIGLGVLYRRRAVPVAWSLLALYAAVATVLAGLKSSLSGAY